MPWLVALGLFGLVCYLARKAPGQPATNLDSDMSVPGTGVTNISSPATSNGSPTASSANALRLDTTYQYAGLGGYSQTRPRRFWAGRDGVVTGGNYMTDAQASLMTQDVPALVTTAPSTTTGTKL